MKTAGEFWNVIAAYNESTLLLQLILSAIMLGIVVASFVRRMRWITVLVSVTFSILFLFVGIVFFLLNDRSATAFIFSPVFILISGLYLFDIFRLRGLLKAPSIVQYLFYAVIISYPAVSYWVGHQYPHQVLLIFPCPLVSFALVTYSRLEKRNDLLNILLILWGLTGIKAFIFDVEEDLILLATGIYGLQDYIRYKYKNRNKAVKLAV